MSTRTPDPISATPPQSRQATIAAEVRAACAALKPAVAAGKAVHDDLTLEMIIDDLSVVASDLALVDRDLQEHGR
jgi:hypothetical protein